MSKILVVVQCRFSSSRLPGKALYPIAGVPMLAFLLRRLKAGLTDNRYTVMLATTETQPDDIVATWGMAEKSEVCRGDEDDLLNRYVKCLETCDAATVVRVTADNPLTCPEIIKWLVQEKANEEFDYIQCSNLPCGAGVDVFSAALLKSFQQNLTDSGEREHINLHILRNPDKFKTLFPVIEGDLARPDLRMTVDTKDDWLSMASLFNLTEKVPWEIPLREAIERMDTKAFC
jgi:spore coat polysaccharide biosynthesis protein SpsF